VDSGLTDYNSALDRLFARTGRTAKFGLERTRTFLALLDNPQNRFESFHVAGTNGKGSAVATIDALLRAKGQRVGRYTSPHLVDFRERIVVDGVPISEAEVNEFLDTWEKKADELGATFFEITTALAFHHFAQHNVEVAVIETGLGGRLDSTNVITPLVAGVTSISIDHTEFLGSTLAEIAREKAGIYKRGVPAVYGPLPPEARDALRETAQSIGAEPIVLATDPYAPANIRVGIDGTTFDMTHRGRTMTMRTSLVGLPQASNVSVSLAMLDAAGARYSATLAEAAGVLPFVELPGRFERRGQFILDVAHNPEGMAALVRTIEAVQPPRPLVIVLGVLRDKDWQSMMKAICPIADTTFVTSAPSAPAARAWNSDDAKSFGIANGWNVRRVAHLSDALRGAADIGATVVVTGSFHTVGDASLMIPKE
jgi:dihydrofolate synthase/folylpolyglutamate synthase